MLAIFFLDALPHLHVGINMLWKEVTQVSSAQKRPREFDVLVLGFRCASPNRIHASRMWLQFECTEAF